MLLVGLCIFVVWSIENVKFRYQEVKRAFKELKK